MANKDFMSGWAIQDTRFEFLDKWANIFRVRYMQSPYRSLHR